MVLATASRSCLTAASRRVAGARKGFSTLYNLEDEYPGLPSTTPTASKATSGSVSTLSNGLVVVSEGASSASTVTLTYPNAGSASESTADAPGAALVNKCLGFRSGSDMSTILINRTIENDGGTPFTALTRNAATLGYTVVPEKAAGLVNLLAIDCSFEKWDVRDAVALAGAEITEAQESAQICLTESLFGAAYGPQSAAGRPLFSCDASKDAFVGFRERSYGLKGAVLAATGVADHAAFCSEVEGLLAGAGGSSSSGGKAADLTYLGGETRIAASAGYAHVAMAFQAPESSVMSNIIEQLFSITGKEAGISGFSTTGLVGVYGGSVDGSGIVDAMTTCVTGSAGGAGDVIKRAKTLAKADALLSLDGGSVALASAMTQSVLETKTFTNAADVAKAYDSVSDAQIKAAVTACLKSNPSLAAVGDITAVPYHATVAARLS